jgi:hypothetical protein
MKLFEQLAEYSDNSSDNAKIISLPITNGDYDAVFSKILPTR